MKKLLSCAVIAVAMMSCQKTEMNLPIDSREIKLTAGVLQMVSETKAPMTGVAFAENTEIGLYGLSDGQTDWTAPFFNNTGTKVVGGAIVFTNQVYYPQDNKAVDFYAFYPKGTPVTTDNGATVAYDLTSQEDILWATVKTGTLSSQKANTLVFAHKLAKVNFKVKAGADFASGLNVTSIVVTGTNTAATMNIQTGALTFETPGDINAFTGTEAIATTVTATAFGDVMIQPGVAYTIKVTAGGVEYTTTLVDAAPAEGKAKTVTLTFLPTGVNVTTSITDWGTVTGEDVDMQK